MHVLSLGRKRESEGFVFVRTRRNEYRKKGLPGRGGVATKRKTLKGSRFFIIGE